jgi:N-acetylmuramoyl-L-alanine amidase
MLKPRGLFLAVLGLAAVSLLEGATAIAAPSSSPATLQHVRIGRHPAYTRIVFELDRPAAYEWHHNEGSNEYSLTLLDTVPANNVTSTVSLRNPHVSTVALTRSTPTSTTAVITAKIALRPHLFLLDHPNRVVIDLFPPAVPSHQPSAQPPSTPLATAPSTAAPPALNDPPAPTLLTKAAPSHTVRTIVIDPGHGGKDPGAIGRGGLKEKDVVLDIAVRLKKLLERQGHTVIMTRSNDTFIPLGDRTQLANSHNADLFVSIHANANPNRHTKGMQVYLLGKATDAEARDTASRENGDDNSHVSDLDKIFNDMALDFRINHSITLAYQTHDAFLRTVGKRYSVVDLGVKRAPFYVLMNSTMPGILAEVSFISNPQEEARLRKASYRQSIAEALARGVQRYLADASVES